MFTLSYVCIYMVQVHEILLNPGPSGAGHIPMEKSQGSLGTLEQSTAFPNLARD
jgi:hypothetical protein